MRVLTSTEEKLLKSCAPRECREPRSSGHLRHTEQPAPTRPRRAPVSGDGGALGATVWVRAAPDAARRRPSAAPRAETFSDARNGGNSELKGRDSKAGAESAGRPSAGERSWKAAAPPLQPLRRAPPTRPARTPQPSGGAELHGAHLALVQSLYKVSKSFLVMSLQRLTPGWMAPNPRRMRTCSTVQTTGDISSRFSLVYTVCSPPTRCLRKRSKTCGRQISSCPSTRNEATFTPCRSTILHSLPPPPPAPVPPPPAERKLLTRLLVRRGDSAGLEYSGSARNKPAEPPAPPPLEVAAMTGGAETAMASPAPAAPRTLAALFAVLLKTAPRARARPPTRSARRQPRSQTPPRRRRGEEWWRPPANEPRPPSGRAPPLAAGGGGRGGAAPAAAPGPRGVRRGAALPGWGGAVAVRGEPGEAGEPGGCVPSAGCAGVPSLPAVAQKVSRSLTSNLLKFRASGAAPCFRCSGTGPLLAPEAARAALRLRSHGPELGGPRCGGSGARKTQRASCVPEESWASECTRTMVRKNARGGVESDAPRHSQHNWLDC